MRGRDGVVRERIQIQCQRERERQGRERKEEFSVFVLNLPRLLDKYGLFGIFQRAGRVCDTYIPIQSNRIATRRFGFVRFTSVEDARRCIQLFHGAIVRGCKLIVSKAKPKRQNQQGSQVQQRTQSDQGCRTPRERLEWRPKVKDLTKRGRIAIFSDEGKATGFSITGDVSMDNEEWLRRSLVGTVEEPRDLASLSSALLCDFDPCVKLSALSSFQFLLTFPTVDRMEEVLVQKDALYYWFSDVKRWGVEDCCGSRRIWLNIAGVPPHGWMWENFKKIAEIWGRFVCLGKQAIATDSFEVMKVCIATNILQKINSEVVLSLGSCGFRITVTEAELVTQGSSMCNKTVLQKELDNIPGFEDIEDIEESESDNIHIGNQVQIGEEEDELANSNSKVGKGQESPRSNDSRHVTPSLTRTKTVSFSTIGDSEEIYKASHHLRTLTAQDFNEGSSPSSQPPPGFEFESQNPPLIDHVQTNNGRVMLSGTSEQDQQENVIVDELTPSKQALLQEPALSNSTEVTSESLKQLAHESLQLGEILGVKVIGDYEAAISRITKPLKKNRGKIRSAARKRKE